MKETNNTLIMFLSVTCIGFNMLTLLLHFSWNFGMACAETLYELLKVLLFILLNVTDNC